MPSTDLLVRAAQPEAAVNLYQQAHAWDRIEVVVLEQAESLMRQGRWQTLLRWHDMLPVQYAERNPWLLYWRAVAEEITDVPRSRLALQGAIDGFQSLDDPIGEILALSAFVEGYFQEWNTVDTMDGGLDALLRLVSRSPQRIPDAYVYRAQASLLIGLVHRRPGDPALRRCVAAITARIAEEADPTERMRMTLFLILYHDLMGDLERVDELLRRTAVLRAVPSVAPRLRIWEAFRSCHHHTFVGNPDKALQESELVLRLARDEGVMISPAFQLLGSAMALLGTGRIARDMTAARGAPTSAAQAIHGSRVLSLARALGTRAARRSHPRTSAVGYLRDDARSGGGVSHRLQSSSDFSPRRARRVRLQRCSACPVGARCCAQWRVRSSTTTST
jgi:hypothetical protein